jgi:CIC family chloride channel protein
MAMAIATERHYEVECIQIILVSRHSSPTETPVNTTKSRRLLKQAEAMGRKSKISVHTQIRVTHDISQAILETIKERHIDLILMGWKGNTSTPGRIFGNVVDTVVRQASCDVVLVKFGKVKEHFPQFDHWLIPMAGGPNAWAAIKLLPALMTLTQAPQIRLARVFHPSETTPDMSILEQAVKLLIRSRKIDSPIMSIPIKSESVSEGIISLVNTVGYDVVVLGASREGMLQQAIKGNIPEAIASGVESTVILVRSAT